MLLVAGVMLLALILSVGAILFGVSPMDTYTSMEGGVVPEFFAMGVT